MNDISLIFDRIVLKNNSAIVFDIDETLIDVNGENIDSVVKFYNYVKSKGVTPMIVTARGNSPRVFEYTKNQLTQNGITGYKNLYLMPRGSNVWEYKSGARKHIASLGYNIEMSIGDKPWDIGPYGGIGVIVEKYDIKHQKYMIENYGQLHISSGSSINSINNSFLRVNVPGIY